MNTNGFSTFGEGIRFAASVIEQMQAWPSAVLLGICLIILGGVLKTLALFPNRAIPAVVLVCGTGVNLLIGDAGQVDPAQRHPEIILAMWGFCVAFGAWMTHALLLKRFEKYLPILNGRSGDTEVISKPNIEPKE